VDGCAGGGCWFIVAGLVLSPRRAKTNAMVCLVCLPKLTYIRIPRCLFWLKRTLGLAPKIRKAEFFSVISRVGFFCQVKSILRKQMPTRFKKQNACSSIHFIFWKASPRLALPHLCLSYFHFFVSSSSSVFYLFLNWNKFW
jgi:hypothetical protein